MIQAEHDICPDSVEGGEARDIDHNKVTGDASELIDLGLQGGYRSVSQRAVENQGACVTVAEQLDPEPRLRSLLLVGPVCRVHVVTFLSPVGRRPVGIDGRGHEISTVDSHCRFRRSP